MDERQVSNAVSLIERGQAAQSFVKQPRGIDVLIYRQVGREFRDSLSQLAKRSHRVCAAFVIERHSEVDDGLQKQLARLLLVEPHVFENLVAFVKLAGVEARDAAFETSLHARFMVAVLRWFQFGKKSDDAPLTGAPAAARLKTYSSLSGYVYQYVFAGQRPASRNSAQGMEYAFEVCYDRKTHHRIWVFVADAAMAEWVSANHRTLTNSERYGVAKIALRNAFDDRPPERIHEPIAPLAAEVTAILDELGV